MSITMALHFQKDEGIDHMCSYVLVDKKFTIVFVNEASYI